MSADARKPARPERVRYTCHWCQKKGRASPANVLEEAFTGRRFCTQACWQSHNKSTLG